MQMCHATLGIFFFFDAEFKIAETKLVLAGVLVHGVAVVTYTAQSK